MTARDDYPLLVLRWPGDMTTVDQRIDQHERILNENGDPTNDVSACDCAPPIATIHPHPRRRSVTRPDPTAAAISRIEAVMLDNPDTWFHSGDLAKLARIHRWAVLYTTLDRMVAEGLLIDWFGSTLAGEQSRRYYQLTPRGLAVLQERAQAARRIMTDTSHEPHGGAAERVRPTRRAHQRTHRRSSTASEFPTLTEAWDEIDRLRAVSTRLACALESVLDSPRTDDEGLDITDAKTAEAHAALNARLGVTRP